MTRHLTTCVLTIVTSIVALTAQHKDAFARVLDASGHAMAEPWHGQVSSDWTASSTQSPPQDLPVFADVASAHHRAAELVDCIQLNTAKHDAELRIAWTTQNMSLRDIERHEQTLAALKSTISKLEARNACAGLSPEVAKANVYPTLLAAAKLGDLSAAACYASAVSPLPENKNPDGYIRTFRNTANDFVRAGIARGDWRFVEVMTQATGSLGHRFDWFGHFVQPSREQGYRYRKLLRLGATGNFATDLDEELASIANKLPPEAVQAMDAEAQKDYEAHFANSPMFNERPIACDMGDRSM